MGNHQKTTPSVYLYIVHCIFEHSQMQCNRDHYSMIRNYD